jgi:glutamine synthetase
MELIYFIPPNNHDEESLKKLLAEHPEIQYVSLMGVDLAGNGTDEKIPISVMLEDIQNFLKHGVQTDGSSVDLNGLTSLNDARVDLLPDISANWYIDYNYYYYNQSCYTRNLIPQQGLPIGTLRIPAFLMHNGNRIDSRAVLQRAAECFEKEMLQVLKQHPKLCKKIGIESIEAIDKVVLTAGTELEFWVRTPDDNADIEKLSASQALKEQYWKRTIGVIRTALEKSIWILEQYGLQPEMGHKEVGGVNSRIESNGKTRYAMEQLEIDWRFSSALQAADNELLAKELIADVFRNHGLEVTFAAKPIEGVAGSGEHTHVGAAIYLKSGKYINIFSPESMESAYLNEIGYGALMGILKNYEIINPFVTATNDGFKRLKPGFEAPICVVASMGHSYDIPSRNRSVLVGLVRDIDNPKATRFEVRSPNPYSNTYLVLASLYQGMLDGIIAAANSNLSSKELEDEISKGFGVTGFYLDKDRMYRSEEDVFEHFTEAERSKNFGSPPATVWENIRSFEIFEDKLAVLKRGNVFSQELIQAYKETTLSHWAAELENRIIPDNIRHIRSCKELHLNEEYTDLDVVLWKKINCLRKKLTKDSLMEKSLFTRIKDALQNQEYRLASALQLEMAEGMKELDELYLRYKTNMMES